MREVVLTYINTPIRRYTFEAPKIREWVEDRATGKVLNLFAGRTKLNLDEFRVDLREDMVADWYGDALEFVTTTDLKFDTIILDPPYGLRKSMTKYNGATVSNYKLITSNLPRLMNKDAHTISFGYSSVGMGKSNGYEKIEVMLMCHGGAQHDTIAVIDKLNCLTDKESLNV